MRVLIVNPNTSRATNARIGAIAAPLIREPDAFEVVSAPSGIELIETVAQSNATVPAVLSVVEQRHEGVDAIVIAAFSDPGLAQAREAASCPVFAISEAAMKTAARIADRFAVITLGAELRGAIEANAAAYGVADQLTGVRILPWTVARVSANPPFYREAFAEACVQAVAEDGAGAVIIGCGGGHDCAVFAGQGVASAMLFVRNDGGSHNSAESMEMADFELAAEVLGGLLDDTFCTTES